MIAGTDNVTRVVFLTQNCAKCKKLKKREGKRKRKCNIILLADFFLCHRV